MDPLDPDFDSREEAARAEARKRGRRDRRQKHTPAQSQRAAGLPPQQHLSQLQSFAAPVMMHLGMMPVVPMAPPPLPPGWSVHLSPAGMPYYYNAVSGQSSWTPPSWPEAAGVAGIDAAVKESAKDAEAKGDAAGGPAGGASAKADESVQEPPEGAEEQNQGEAEGLGDSRAAVDSDTEVVAEDQAVPETAVAMKRLPDTPWAIVLTNRRHELYFNSQTKQATWEMPGEIVNVVGELLARAMDVDIDDDVDDDEADDDGDDGDDGEDDGEDDDEDDDDEESRKGESLNPSDTDIHDAGIDVSKNDFVAVGHRSENAGDLEGGDGSRKRSADSADLGDSPLDRTHAPALVILAAKERKKLFDKFCQTRASAVAESATAASKSAREAYITLLNAEANMRTRFSDFSRKFKRDPRFANFSSMREKEAMFLAHIEKLKELSAKKRQEELAQVKTNYIAMLRESHWIKPHTAWRDARPRLEGDPRYAAVQSAVDRETWFRTHVADLAIGVPSDAREASLREREEYVRLERAKQQHRMHMQLGQLQREEAVAQFKSLLLDSVRSHLVKLDQVDESLQRDARYPHQLSDLDRRQVFSEHTSMLFEKRLAEFHSLLDTVTTLSSTFDELLPFLLSDPRTVRLEQRSNADLERLFSDYMHLKRERAEAALEEVLSKNAFIDFHVRAAVQSAIVEAVEKGQREPAEDDEWRWISLDDIRQVLSGERAWTVFDEHPKERDRMLMRAVKLLVARVRGEKGGTRDLVVAEHAGAHAALRHAGK